MEAPDDGTIVHPAGAECSAPGTLPSPNPPHSQSRTGEGQGGRKRAATNGDCHQAETKAATKNMTKKFEGLKAGDGSKSTGDNRHQAKNKATGGVFKDIRLGCSVFKNIRIDYFGFKDIRPGCYVYRSIRLDRIVNKDIRLGRSVSRNNRHDYSIFEDIRKKH